MVFGSWTKWAAAAAIGLIPAVAMAVPAHRVVHHRHARHVVHAPAKRTSVRAASHTGKRVVTKHSRVAHGKTTHKVSHHGAHHRASATRKAVVHG